MRVRVLPVMVVIATTLVAVSAQQDPVATMFREDFKREPGRTMSFLPIDLPTAGAATPLKVYLSAGDLERAFDEPRFRPDAAIVPTNTALDLAAASPATQRVLFDRVRKQKTVLADLQDQIEMRRKTPAAAGGDVLQIAVDAFVAQLPRSGGSAGAFPKWACLIATEFAKGGAIDRRELFGQNRVRQGVARCLAALDQAGAGSVIIPLLGASSGKLQKNDPAFEGQRQLLECRQINSAAGIALGVHDFAAGRKSILEIGILQWNREIAEMFPAGRLAQAAYRPYAEQMQRAVNKGIAGETTTAADVNGSCAAMFNPSGGN